jgi:hypothetical protein
VWYYRVAGDAQLEAGNWDEADRCAEELQAITSAEPLPLVEFITARIRALSAVGRGERGAHLRDAIDRLIAQGEAKGHDSWLVALENGRDSLASSAGAR